jgi:ABC-type uncharacterized transport system involved in gliding motility auxiliary subunit
MVMKQKYSLLLFIVNIILYLVVVALWISIPDVLTLNIAVTGLSFFISMLLIYLNQERFKTFYLSSHFKKFSETFIYLTLLFSLLSIGNYWAFKHPTQLDLSIFKLSTLTDQTTNVLNKMPGKVKFKIFARKQEGFLWYTLLEQYRARKNDIEIEKIDIDVQPDKVMEYNISSEATLVIEYNDKRQYVTDRDELNVTNALIKISRTSDPVVYFVTGHNEQSIQSKENEGLSFIFEAMKNSAIDVRPLTLSTTQEIPFDSKVLILFGPKTRLMKSEVLAIEHFLDRGGRLFLGLDPDLNTDANREMRDLLMHYHLNLRNDLVVDRKSFVNGSNGTIPLVDTFNPDHPITRKFKGQAFFPLVSSIEEFEPTTKKPDEKITFLTSSNNYPESWAETSLKEIVAGTPSFTPGKDIAGPINLMATYESSKNKIVLIGNSSLVSNAYMKYGNNFALFLNSLSWLVDEDRLISFNLPIIQSERMFISGPQFGIIFYFSVLFSPIVLLGFSIFMYRRKRVR